MGLFLPYVVLLLPLLLLQALIWIEAVETEAGPPLSSIAASPVSLSFPPPPFSASMSVFSTGNLHLMFQIISKFKFCEKKKHSFRCGFVLKF